MGVACAAASVPSVLPQEENTAQGCQGKAMSHGGPCYPGQGLHVVFWVFEGIVLSVPEKLSSHFDFAVAIGLTMQPLHTFFSIFNKQRSTGASVLDALAIEHFISHASAGVDVRL